MVNTNLDYTTDYLMFTEMDYDAVSTTRDTVTSLDNYLHMDLLAQATMDVDFNTQNYMI